MVQTIDPKIQLSFYSVAAKRLIVTFRLSWTVFSLFCLSLAVDSQFSCHTVISIEEKLRADASIFVRGKSRFSIRNENIWTRISNFNSVQVDFCAMPRYFGRKKPHRMIREWCVCVISSIATDIRELCSPAAIGNRILDRWNVRRGILNSYENVLLLLLLATYDDCYRLRFSFFSLHIDGSSSFDRSLLFYCFSSSFSGERGLEAEINWSKILFNQSTFFFGVLNEKCIECW